MQNVKKEKVYAFIDSQNLNLSVQNDILNPGTNELIYKGWKLDFRRFLIYATKIEIKKEGVTFGRTLGVPSHRDYIYNSHIYCYCQYL